MAKVTNVNIDCSVRQGSQALFDLKALLLANGWTITGTSDGTSFTNGPAPDNVSTVALFDLTNAWYVLADPSGTCWIYVQRGASNTVFTVKVSRVAPQANGTATALPTCAVLTNETTLVSSATLFNASGVARAHIITYNAAENAAGVRPFYLLMTDGTTVLRGSFIVEAMADDTYDATNVYPWAAAAGSGDTGIQFTGQPIYYYYSPGNIFVRTDWTYPVYSAGPTFNYTGAPSPWSGQDMAMQVLVGKGASLGPANVLGCMKNIQYPLFYRGYPNTFTTVSGDRYVYAVTFIIPYADGVTPL